MLCLEGWFVFSEPIWRASRCDCSWECGGSVVLFSPLLVSAEWYSDGQMCTSVLPARECDTALLTSSQESSTIVREQRVSGGSQELGHERRGFRHK